jgi:hypothetical protein
MCKRGKIKARQLHGELILVYRGWGKNIVRGRGGGYGFGKIYRPLQLVEATTYNVRPLTKLVW